MRVKTTHSSIHENECHPFPPIWEQKPTWSCDLFVGTEFEAPTPKNIVPSFNVLQYQTPQNTQSCLPMLVQDQKLSKLTRLPPWLTGEMRLLLVMVVWGETSPNITGSILTLKLHYVEFCGLQTMNAPPCHALSKHVWEHTVAVRCLYPTTNSYITYFTPPFFLFLMLNSK